MWIGIITALACLALGLVLGWFANRWIEVGGRSTDPLPELPPLTEQYYRQLRAEHLTEQARLHAEWDAAYRKLCPPEPGVVWRRRIHQITDFNN